MERAEEAALVPSNKTVTDENTEAPKVLKIRKMVNLTCIFCGHVFSSIKPANRQKRYIDRRHCYSCPVMKRLQPKRTCKYCGNVDAEGKSCLHEASCHKNPNKNRKKRVCPNCAKVVGTYPQLRSHLTHCLPKLRDLVEKLKESNDSIKPSTLTKTVSVPLKRVKASLPRKAKNPKLAPSNRFIQCNFCKEDRKWISFRTHVFACRSIPEKYNSIRTCRRCKLVQPLGESLVHESQCTDSKTGSSNVFKCVNCDKCEFHEKSLLLMHLSRCVNYFQKMKKDMMGGGVTDDACGSGEDQVVQSKKSKLKVKLKKGIQTCPFCKNGRKLPSLNNHLIFCKNFKPFQTIQKCNGCSKKGTKTYIHTHESYCLSTKKGLNLCTICSQNFHSTSRLIYHLGKTCLKDYLDNMVKKHASTDEDKENHNNEAEPLTNDSSAGSENEEMVASLDPEPIKEVVPETDPDPVENPAPIKMEVDEEDDIVFIGSKVKIEKPDPEPEMPVTNDIDNRPKATPVIIRVASQSSQVICPFCPKTFTSIHDLKTKHPLSCNGIKKFEPEKNCPHCDIELPTSLCGLHILICKKNKCKMPLTIDNLQHCDIFCPECDIVTKAKGMPEHLATCLKHVQLIMENALINPTLNWRHPQVTDYIAKAGLAYWLKDDN